MQGISVSLQNRFTREWSRKQLGEGARHQRPVEKESKKKSKKSKRPKWE